MHPFPADISSTRRESTNKNEAKCLTIFRLAYWWEGEGWVLKYRLHMATGPRLNKSLSSTVHSASTRYVHVQFTCWASSLLVPLVSAFTSVLMRNYLRQRGEGLRRWDVNPLSLPFIEVSGWCGGERGTHIPIIQDTWFICTCGTSCMIMEGS